MIRVLGFLVLLGAVAIGLAWLADRPGEVAISWQGWRLETSVMVLVIAVAATAIISHLLWTGLRFLLTAPRRAARLLNERGRRNAQRAVMRGLVAIGAGDARAAARYAREAQRAAADEPLTLLLRAQAAQICGEPRAAEGIFRIMAAHPETHLLGLHGLYIEARRRGDRAAARHIAEQAAARQPALAWAAQAVLEARCAAQDWQGALAILEANFKNGLIDKSRYQRHSAVLLAAHALAVEATEPGLAKSLAIEATRLAPDLVPAAALAGRLLAEAGEPRWAARILISAWRANPHPELAEAYSYLRPGDSARDRLARVQSLIRERDDQLEAPLALARAAIDAGDFALARESLEPLLARPTQRVAMLMAELEQQEHADEGRAREWMARAVHAANDPAWTADGFVAEQWLPVSPVSGRIDAFEWKVPLEQLPGPARVIEAVRSSGGIAAGIDGQQQRQTRSSEPRTQGGCAGSGAGGALAIPANPGQTGGSDGPRPGSGHVPEPFTPIPHAPDDPGPGPEPSGKAELSGKRGWRRLTGLFR